MKKIIVTASTLLLLGGGITYAVNASPDTTPKVEDQNETYGESIQNKTGDTYESYEEYSTLSEEVGAKESNMQLIKDNKNTRIMLLTDDHGEPQYKSIYVKKKDRLKVVDFDGGLIFNEVLGSKSSDVESSDKDVKEEATTNKALEELVEYPALKDSVDLNEYVAYIVEDNSNKRVMILKDNQGKAQYKSIYVKKTNRLKVVDFDSGLVFNEVLDQTSKKADDKVVVKEKTEKKAPAPAPKTESKAPAPKAEPKAETKAPAPKAEPKAEAKAPAPKAEPKAEEKAPAPKAEKKEPAPKKEPKTEAPKSESEGLTEYATIKSHVNVSDYTTNVVEDNPYKRIIVLKDNNSKPRYKSIYIKDSNRLKIINLRGGLVYNGIIK